MMSGPASDDSSLELKKDEDLTDATSILTLTPSQSGFGYEETEDGYNSGEHYDTACMAGYASGEMYDLPVVDHPLHLKERRNSQISEELDRTSRDTATPPLDPFLIHEISGTEITSCDSDGQMLNVAYASDSSGPLLQSWQGKVKKRGPRKLSTITEKKTPRNRRHDHFFHIYDSKYWELARFGLFWLSMTGIVSFIGTAAVMIIVMPTNCDPPRDWWQGEVILEITPTKNLEGTKEIFGVTKIGGTKIDIWKYKIDIDDLIEKVPLMQKTGFKTLKLKDIYRQDIKEKESDSGKTWESPDDTKIIQRRLKNMDSFHVLVKKLHHNNMTLIVEIPALEKGMTYTGTAQRNNMSMELLQAIERGIRYWANKGVDGISIIGLENFVNDPWMVDNSKSWRKILDKYGTSPNIKILISSYLVGQDAVGNFDLLDDCPIHPRKSIDGRKVDKWDNSSWNGMISHVEGVAKWDNSPSNPWINWNLLTTNLAELSFHLFLPGTITLHHSYHILDPNSLASQLMKIRFRAVPVHMNGNYRRCHGGCKGEWTNKETNYQIHQLKNLVLLERHYNRRNRYMVIANMKEYAVSLEEVAVKYSGGQLILNTSSLVQTPRFINFNEVNLDGKQAYVIKFPK